MHEIEFKVGDRVIAVKSSDSNPYIVGVTGTVIAAGDICQVVYDDDIKGHDLNGKCEDGRGWFTNAKCLELYEDPEPLAFSISYEELMT